MNFLKTTFWAFILVPIRYHIRPFRVSYRDMEQQFLFFRPYCSGIELIVSLFCRNMDLSESNLARAAQRVFLDRCEATQLPGEDGSPNPKRDTIMSFQKRKG